VSGELLRVESRSVGRRKEEKEEEKESSRSSGRGKKILEKLRQNTTAFA
jgi:hypothetical protein